MALEKWSPLRELDTMRREMDRIWEELFPSVRRPFVEARGRKPEGGTAVPAIDIIDKNEEIIIVAEMPGVAKENVDISLQENTLTIKGEIKDTEEFKDENYYYSERAYRSYLRSIDIPFKINPDNMKANLNNGLLYIHVQKAVEVQPKKIKVEIS